MDDTIALYRTAQVMTSNPLERVVMLYEAAVRFATRHLAALEAGDNEAAHQASIRCQETVAELQEVLDLSAGPIATHLDALYRFILDRLAAGNLARSPEPTSEALGILRELLTSWHEIARRAKAHTPAILGGPLASFGEPGAAAADAGGLNYRHTVVA